MKTGHVCDYLTLPLWVDSPDNEVRIPINLIGGSQHGPKEILASALAAVREAEVPESLQPIAFERAIDLLIKGSARDSSYEPSERESTPRSREPQRRSDEGNGLGRIAARLELDVDTVADVFHEENDEIRVVVAARRLEESMQAATQQVALLVCAGRQGAGIEEWTSVDEIRRVADEKGVLSSGNFAAHLKAMDTQFNVTGSCLKRQVRLTRKGWDEARDLVNALGGGEP